jgi:hypothetical protein
MEDRSSQAGSAERPFERPPTAPGGDGVGGQALGPPHLADPRSLTILTTEHWSLLTQRSLVYNEAFARSGMFLTFITGSLVALGFVSQGMGFGREFLVIAAALLSFDLFLGLATLGRISSASDEEFRALQGMNRLRHAYLEMVPSLEPYFSTSHYDDWAGILSTYGGPVEGTPGLRDFLHGFTTAPGMIATICAAIAGGLAATVALLFGAAPLVAIFLGLSGVVAFIALGAVVASRAVQDAETGYEVRFPRPPD